MTTASYAVKGLTRGYCLAELLETVNSLSGVAEHDLNTPQCTVISVGLPHDGLLPIAADAPDKGSVRA